jgi:hypothetical protein
MLVRETSDMDRSNLHFVCKREQDFCNNTNSTYLGKSHLVFTNHLIFSAIIFSKSCSAFWRVEFFYGLDIFIKLKKFNLHPLNEIHPIAYFSLDPDAYVLSSYFHFT